MEADRSGCYRYRRVLLSPNTPDKLSSLAFLPMKMESRRIWTAQYVSSPLPGFLALCEAFIELTHLSPSPQLAYQNAAWSAMNYLEKFGYTREQAYLLLSTAPIESRVVATANRPNMVVSIGLPIDIFEFNIDPSANTEGIVKREISGPAVLSAAGRALERSGAGH